MNDSQFKYLLSQFWAGVSLILGIVSLNMAVTYASADVASGAGFFFAIGSGFWSFCMAVTSDGYNRALWRSVAGDSIEKLEAAERKLEGNTI